VVVLGIVIIVVVMAKVKQQESVGVGVSCHMLATSTWRSQHKGGTRSEDGVLVVVERIVVIAVLLVQYCLIVG